MTSHPDPESSFEPLLPSVSRSVVHVAELDEFGDLGGWIEAQHVLRFGGCGSWKKWLDEVKVMPDMMQIYVIRCK